MTGFIVLIALFFIVTFFIGWGVGNSALKKRLRTCVKEGNEIRLNSLINDDFGWWIMFVVLMVYLIIFFVPMLDGVRDYYIDKYRNDEIVEQISYKYRVVGGEKQISDSTFMYVKNK